jgi:hypothetical protein
MNKKRNVLGTDGCRYSTLCDLTIFSNYSGQLLIHRTDSCYNMYSAHFNCQIQLASDQGWTKSAGLHNPNTAALSMTKDVSLLNPLRVRRGGCLWQYIHGYANLHVPKESGRG